MSDPYTNPGGWNMPLQAKKFHWFIDGMSLCGKWMFTGGDDKDRGQASHECCKECTKRLTKRDSTTPTT